MQGIIIEIYAKFNKWRTSNVLDIYKIPSADPIQVIDQSNPPPMQKQQLLYIIFYGHTEGT
jgi:hypothetical protein